MASTNSRRILLCVGAAVVLAMMCFFSITVGARDISLSTIWSAVFSYDGANEQVMIRELRIPRTLVGLVVGPALGLSGALIQAFTRNPLADPGILGVNAGASFAVTVAIGVLGITHPLGYLWFAMLGAFAVTVLVYAIGASGNQRATPVKLTLAGVAVSAVLAGFSTAVVLKSTRTLDIMRFWGVGSIAGRSLETLLQCLPFILVGAVLTFAVARALNSLALGDELATALGVRLDRMRIVVIVAVTILGGAAVALAGPIGFVGLMVPMWCVGS